METPLNNTRPLAYRMLCFCMAMFFITPFITMATAEPMAATMPTEPTEPVEPIEPSVTEPEETKPEETEPGETEPPTEPPVTEPIETEPPVTETPTEPYVPKYYDVPLSNELQDHIFTLCEGRGIDPAVIIAMIKKESNYNAGSVGDSGNSLGLMQIQPKWHQGRMDGMGVTNLLDPYQNVMVGISLFADYYAAGNGSVEYALMRYNAGRKKAEDMIAAGQVTGYVTKVFAIMESFERRD